MRLVFTVPGDPVAKGRAKVSTFGGKVRAYTPPKTRNYETLVRLACEQAMDGQTPFDGPLYLRMDVYLSIPESWSKRKKAAALEGTVFPTKKPDLSNVLKAVEDGMNSVAYTDDSRIVNLASSKRYSDRPRVEVEVFLLDGASA